MEASSPPPEPVAEQPAEVPPYGLGRMLEDSLTVAFRPGTVFDALALRPAPSGAMAWANLGIFLTAGACLNLWHWAMLAPAGFLPAAPKAAALMLGLFAALMLASVVAAGLLHGLALLSGGEGGFARSRQILSLLSPLALAQSLLNVFGLGSWWPVPPILGVALAVSGVQRLHRAPPPRAWAVFSVAAGLTLGAEWLALRSLQNLTQRLLLAQAMASLAVAPVPMEQLPALPTPMTESIPALQPLQLGNLLLAPLPKDEQPEETAAGAPPLPTSGRPAAQTAAPTRQGLTFSPKELAAMQASFNMMAGPMKMMFNNPAVRKGMSKEQLRQLDEFNKFYDAMQESLKTGKPPPPAEQEAMMENIMKMMGTMGSALGAPQQPGQQKRENRP